MMTATNSLAVPMTDFVFQAAVPKVCRNFFFASCFIVRTFANHNGNNNENVAKQKIDEYEIDELCTCAIYFVTFPSRPEQNNDCRREKANICIDWRT